MIEKGFICETEGQWKDADVHFGFQYFKGVYGGEAEGVGASILRP
jgi:hypothetical protein